ncbi:12350_t:CDS:2, partial [Racocetra fulgida]
MSSEIELDKFVFVENWNTEALITFLQKQKLNVDEEVFNVLRKAEVNGQSFLMMTEDKFIKAGVALEVFKLYKISGDSIIDIPQFEPGDNSSLCFCVEDIKRKLENMGSVIDSNEAMRYEYISTILHASVTILKSIIKDRIRVLPQFEVSGINDRVDYVIKKIMDQSAEEILCITEGKPYQLKLGVLQNIVQCKSSQKVYRIPLDETSLNDDTELRRSVKEILEIIIGILEDRANVDISPVKKKQRIDEYFKKE